ncbi:MAG: argininosuccinate synthase [Thermoplasmatota archaeon]
MREKAVLGYSGGLDTSVAIRWLQENYKVDVICVLVDVGQPLSNLDDALSRAKKNGAEKAVVVDAKDEFANRFVAEAIRAGARYEGIYPLATALARPLIAEKLVEIAHAEGATYIAHGCTGKGNDQVRFDVTIRALDPDLKVIAPLREWKMTREGEIEYAKQHGILIPAIAAKRTFSTDENLWGRSVESGVLEDPGAEVHPDAWAWTTSPQTAPDAPEEITLTFANGIPTAVDGKQLALAELIAYVNTRAGAHGIGRIDHVENRLVGIKSREVYEAPAAAVILQAKEALEALTLTRDIAHYQVGLSAKFSELVYDGLWYSPLREAISAFFGRAAADVEGEVTLKLFKGSAWIAGRSSAHSLYRKHLATYDQGDTFRHDSATGFIDIWGLPLANYARTKAAAGTPKPTSGKPQGAKGSATSRPPPRSTKG